jgi:predicted transcriptional regulator
MASTTTLKLPEPLKKRIAPLAEASGKTPHAWMLEALETQATLGEQRKRLIEDALVSVSDTERTGRVYAAQDVRKYILAKAAGRKARRPKPLRR